MIDIEIPVCKIFSYVSPIFKALLRLPSCATSFCYCSNLSGRDRMNTELSKKGTGRKQWYLIVIVGEKSLWNMT